MRKGTSKYGERVSVFLNVDITIRELAKSLKLHDADAYTKGVLITARERSGDLTEQQYNKVIQQKREFLKQLQDEIALDERIAMDLRIRDDARKRIKTVVRHDERGRPYEAVMAD